MLIINAKLVTWGKPNQIVEGQAVYIVGDKIEAMGTQAELLAAYPEAERMDANGQYLMPASICAHTHFYGAYARGMSIPGDAPSDFMQILKKLWWPLDLALDAESVRLSALVCLVDAIKHGTTTLLDHHASPEFIDGSLDVIAEAVDEAGLRAVLCYEVTDRNGVAGFEAGVRENVRFIRRIQQEKVAGGRVKASFGLHAGLTLSNSSLEICRAAVPAGTGFHVHVAESDADQVDSVQKSGVRMVHRLNQHGILGPTSIAVHAVHVDSSETSLLANSGTWVTHQPRSNMNNAVGVSDVESMLAAGVKVCLGNDGFSNAMWEEWKAAYLLHKAWNKDPRRMPASTIVDMAVYNNAALAKVFFPEAPIGILEVGAFADLILVDYHPFTPLSAGNLPWQIVFGFHESMITMTMASGKILMKDRKLLTLDEGAIVEKALEKAPQVWQLYLDYVNQKSW